MEFLILGMSKTAATFFLFLKHGFELLLFHNFPCVLPLYYLIIYVYLLAF